MLPSPSPGADLCQFWLQTSKGKRALRMCARHSLGCRGLNYRQPGMQRFQDSTGQRPGLLYHTSLVLPQRLFLQGAQILRLVCDWDEGLQQACRIVGKRSFGTPRSRDFWSWRCGALRSLDKACSIVTLKGVYTFIKPLPHIVQAKNRTPIFHCDRSFFNAGAVVCIRVHILLTAS